MPKSVTICKVPVPQLKPDDVLVKVSACSLNQTDVNTRLGWYGKAADDLADPGAASEAASEGAGGWGSGSTEEDVGLKFPRIQGADIVGRIVKVGSEVDEKRLGEHVLVFTWVSDPNDPDAELKYIGSELDGGFAEFAAVPARNAFALGETGLSEAELAALPCAYSTAENLLTKTRVKEGDVVLIRGASGGVGTALVQLCRFRKAQTIAVASKAKLAGVLEMGATFAYARDDKLEGELRKHRISVCLDIVGGEGFGMAIRVLARGGRYAASGAIGGPNVAFDLRELIYKDMEFYGATRMGPDVFAQLLNVLHTSDVVRPAIARTFPLAELSEAQAYFGAKAHVGKVVITIAQ